MQKHRTTFINILRCYTPHIYTNNANELKPVKERNKQTQSEDPKIYPERDLNPRPRLSINLSQASTLTVIHKNNINLSQMKTNHYYFV